ncbi:hypothetical protein [Catenulispora rubra]|uniref:hypothetical protein n=1 Tax=Catenulispora rubra TaxID=280293 RepID=UPI001891FC68|nr:hypothetical protein [Catenulispora rubra]
MSERRRRPRVLGEYELDGGAFALARGEQRDTATLTPILTLPPTAQQRLRALGRPGTLWRAVLRRIRTT